MVARPGIEAGFLIVRCDWDFAGTCGLSLLGPLLFRRFYSEWAPS